MRSKLFATVAAAVALGTLAAPSASVARPAGAGNEKSSACPGGTLLTAVSARRLPAGSTAYTYELPDGTSFENTAPPSGFNIATASNSLLAELHLSERPVGAAVSAAATRDWEADVTPFRTFGISGSDKFCATPDANPEMSARTPQATTAGQRAVGVAPMGSVGHQASTGFSGYELRSGTYHRAVGHFTQPGVSGAITSRVMSSWVGLNSASNGRLVQAGAGDGYGSPGGSPFWELYCSPNPGDCNGAQVHSEFPSYPGDVISVNVSYDNNNMSYYQVAINGVLRINTSKQMRSDSYTGAVADFITERSGTNTIPSFTTIQFSGARTYADYNSSASVPFGSQNYYAYEMTSDNVFHSSPCSTSPYLLMYPSNVTSDGFVNNFCRNS
jgi:hypothetical protein